jgi:hypothetical protein
MAEQCRTARTRHRVPLQTCRRRLKGQGSRASEQARRAPCVYLLPANVLSDGVCRLPQYTTTYPILRRRSSETITHTASQMAPITMSAIRLWARLIRHMHAAYSSSMRFQTTCFPIPALSLIPSSGVKRSRTLALCHFHPQLADVYNFSSSRTLPDFPASCFLLRRLSSIRELQSRFVSC